MESLGSEFDGKITYSPKDVRIKGTMAETSTIDCAAYVSTGIHILGLNLSGGEADNPQWGDSRIFDYTPVRKRMTEIENGCANLAYNTTVDTCFTASSLSGVDKTGMIGVTIEDIGWIIPKYKLDHSYVSLDENATKMTDSHGQKYGIGSGSNIYSGSRTKFFLQLTLPEDRKAE